VIETTWSNLRPIEIHRNGLLHSRRVYGARLDEVAVLERDTSGDGVMDTAYYPIYDHTGNLALVTNDVGKPVERYDYSPFGTRRITVDATKPVIEQVRIRGTEVWIELSEAVSTAVVAESADSGKIVLTNTTTQSLHTLSVAQPVVEGRQRGRRIVIEFNDTSPNLGDTLELRVEPQAIVDYFLNTLSETFQLDFSWTGTNEILHDSSPPIVDGIDVRNHILEIEFTEPIDLVTAKPSIQVAGHVCDWSVDATGYRVIAGAPLPPGLHDIVITTTLLDLAGTPLATPFIRQVLVEEGESFLAWYRRPDPRVSSTSTLSNELGFHGLPHDPVTGFVYMRNRYYDPEMARFITPDPLGYVDGPSQYQFAKDSPFNYSDPLGLDAIAIAFPEYLIGVGYRDLPFLGHAAFVSVGSSGVTRYYQYGRYDPEKLGTVDRRSIPDFQLGPNGLPTRESLKRVLRRVSTYGQDGLVRAAYFVTDDEDTGRMNLYAAGRQKQNNDHSREPYSTTSNNCSHFAQSCLEEGGVNTPLQIDPRPISYIWELQRVADFRIVYDPETDTLTVDDSMFTADRDAILEWKQLPWLMRKLTRKPH